MTELLPKTKAVEMFMLYGHLFHPGQLKGRGEVTVLYIGPEEYYTECTVTQFCKRLIKECHIDEELVRRFARETLGQRKHVPLILQRDFVLVPFGCRGFSNPYHRTVYACHSSVETYMVNSEDSLCTLILRDHHTFELACSRRQLMRQLRNADHVRNRYITRSRPPLNEGYPRI